MERNRGKEKDSQRQRGKKMIQIERNRGKEK